MQVYHLQEIIIGIESCKLDKTGEELNNFSPRPAPVNTKTNR